MHESMCDLNCGLRPEAREKQVNAMIETKTREREREREEERERERALCHLLISSISKRQRRWNERNNT